MLLAITLLTIVVIEFTDTAQVETHLALSARNALQATYLARSGVNVAEALVIVDAQISPGNDGAAGLLGAAATRRCRSATARRSSGCATRRAS